MIDSTPTTSANPTPAAIQAARGRQFTWLAPLLLALTGVGLTLAITRLGAYLSDDSYYYVEAARQALAGNGFHPSYIFAPFFPLALTLVGVLNIDPVIGARWLNALLFGVNLWLVWRIARRMGLSVPFALLASALVLFSDVTLEAHGWVMSEALSFTFMLLSVLLLLGYLERSSRRSFWLSALCAALAVLTRYAALPLIAALALTVLLFGPGRSFLARFKQALGYGLLGIAPIVLYWLRNQLTAGHPVRYERFLLEPLTRDQVSWFMYHWYSLFVPGRLLRGHEILAGALLTLASALLVAGLVWVYRRQWREDARPLFHGGLFMLAALVVFNFLMLIIARGLTELDVFNPRYLVPVLIAFLILMAAFGSWLWQVGSRPLRLAVVAFFAVFLLYYGYRTFDFSGHMMRIGLGYANNGWHESETVEYILDHPELTEMVSTGEMGIYFWTGRKPRVLADFPGPGVLRAHLCQTGSVFFLMDQMPAEIYGLTYDQAIAGLELVQRFNDSEMYRCPSGN